MPVLESHDNPSSSSRLPSSFLHPKVDFNTTDLLLWGQRSISLRFLIKALRRTLPSSPRGWSTASLRSLITLLCQQSSWSGSSLVRNVQLALALLCEEGSTFAFLFEPAKVFRLYLYLGHIGLQKSFSSNFWMGVY